jgi:hypothetical protein
LLELSAPLLERSLLLITALMPALSSFGVHPHRCTVRAGGASMSFHELWHLPLTLLFDRGRH